ncbi:MAG: hypothetical protein R3Y09_13185 [Clostridia bacterium]
MYLQYETYKDMGGELNEIDFARFNFMAELKINEFSRNKITEDMALKYEQILKYLSFEIVELFSLQNKTTDVVITSESNEGMSQTFKNSTNNEIDERINAICLLSLKPIKTENNVSILYLGVQ